MPAAMRRATSPRNSSPACRDRPIAVHVSGVRDRRRMRAHTHNWPPWWAAAIVVAGLVALAGCDGGSNAAPTTTAPVSSTTETTASADEQQVLADYRAYWDAYLAAGEPMNPEHPDLAAHATGAALDTLQRSFLSLKSAGKVIRGDLDLDPRVVEVKGTAATVRDCYGDNTGVYDADTGEREDEPTGQRHLVTATLLLEEGTWKVERLEEEGLGCTAP